MVQDYQIKREDYQTKREQSPAFESPNRQQGIPNHTEFMDTGRRRSSGAGESFHQSRKNSASRREHSRERDMTRRPSNVDGNSPRLARKRPDINRREQNSADDIDDSKQDGRRESKRATGSPDSPRSQRKETDYKTPSPKINRRIKSANFDSVSANKKQGLKSNKSKCKDGKSKEASSWDIPADDGTIPYMLSQHPYNWATSNSSSNRQPTPEEEYMRGRNSIRRPFYHRDDEDGGVVYRKPFVGIRYPYSEEPSPYSPKSRCQSPSKTYKMSGPRISYSKTQTNSQLIANLLCCVKKGQFKVQSFVFLKIFCSIKCMYVEQIQQI